MTPQLLHIPLPPGPAKGRPAGASSLLIDPALAVLAADAAALRLVEAHPALISLRGGRLHLPRHQTALEAAVGSLLSTATPACRGLALPRPAQPPLTLKLERHLHAGPARLWLHLMDTTAVRLDVDLLADMFSLTTAERRVALLLAQGLSTEDMASRLGVQSNTIRGHIKQLLAKTHTKRQAQLAALLWRSAAVVHEDVSPPSSSGATPPVSDDATQLGNDSIATGFDTARRTRLPQTPSRMS